MAGVGSKHETSLDLGRLGLSPGGGRRIELTPDLEGLSLGGLEYSLALDEPLRLGVSRTAHGWAFHLTLRAHVEGACMRCLEGARPGFDVEAREIEEPSESDDELHSPYVDGDELDVGRWAHDAIALAVPQQIVCRPDCAGLCPVCGESLNDADPAAHEHETVRDPRWAALDKLK